MRRVVTVIVATIGGLALLASFHTTPGVADAVARRADVRRCNRRRAGHRPTSAGSTGTSPSATRPGTARRAPSPTATPPSHRGAGVADDRRAGRVESLRRRAGRDRGARTVNSSTSRRSQLPSDRARSRYISSIAGPELRQEALQARSANIDVISGATYTSESYAQSLQGALDQAGL